MEIRQYIETLRSRPAAERERWVVFAAAGVTALLFLAWLISMKYGYFSRDTVAETQANRADSPFTILGEKIGSSFSEIKAQFAQ